MANLQTTTVNGLLTITGYVQQGGNSNLTGWVKLSHCYDPYSRLHVRTPLPESAISSTASILEVVGYHSYSGEKVHDFKALCYGSGTIESLIGTNNGYNTNPYVYLSTNTYGGTKRVCFSVDKITCCCTGYLWVRWWNNSSYFNDYAWATMGANDTQASPVKQF